MRHMHGNRWASPCDHGAACSQAAAACSRVVLAVSTRGCTAPCVVMTCCFHNKAVKRYDRQTLCSLCYLAPIGHQVYVLLLCAVFPPCSVGRDKAVKYWDMDRWELLLDLPGHHGDVQTLAISQYGDFVVTGGHKSARMRRQRPCTCVQLPVRSNPHRLVSTCSVRTVMLEQHR